MRSRNHIYLPLTCTLLALGFIGCKRQEADPRTQPELVRVTTVQSAGESEGAFTGVVTARVQSDLGFRVAGKITKRLVDTGQTVHRGQLLMRMDVTDFSNAITSHAQDVTAAKARADQAIADEARYRGLVSTGAVSASTYDQIKATADAARAQLSAAQAQAAIAKNEGSYTELVADADGVVVQTLAEPGQVVSAGQAVIKLAHSGPREAAVNLPEGVRPQLGSTVAARLYGGEAANVSARLRQLSDAADPLTRTFEARYVLQGAAANAPLGSTVTVYLHGAEQGHSITVPIAAITDKGSGPGVWILDASQSRVSFRSVRVAALGSEEATLSGGVQTGEKIVALGAHLLSEGQKVRVEEQKAAIR
jgi:RND family efflux transporter MFP subunit